MNKNNDYFNFTTLGSSYVYGDINYKGSIKNIDDVDFEKLIPDDHIKSEDLEHWFTQRFKEQDIDSSIRREILTIVNEFKPIKIPLAHIHGGIKSYSYTGTPHSDNYFIHNMWKDKIIITT